MWHDMTWYKPQQFSGNLPVQATVRTELCPLTSLYYLYISIQKNTLEKKLLLPRSFLKIFKQVPICSNCLLLRRTWTSWAVFSFLHVSTIDPASWPWWSHRWCQWTNLDQRAFVAKLKQKQSMTQNSEIQELWPSLTQRKKEHTYKTNMYQYVPTCTNIYQWYTSSIGVYAPTAMYFLSQIQALHIDFNTGVSDFKPFKMHAILMRLWDPSMPWLGLDGKRALRLYLFDCETKFAWHLHKVPSHIPKSNDTHFALIMFHQVIALWEWHTMFCLNFTDPRPVPISLVKHFLHILHHFTQVLQKWSLELKPSMSVHRGKCDPGASEPGICSSRENA